MEFLKAKYNGKAIASLFAVSSAMAYPAENSASSDKP
jgi:hypothetical protein